ncbi:MAG: response regulator [Alphaproteobacteria bacterium]|nr:response regulator [Alphaproteobacteria bacterium]
MAIVWIVDDQEIHREGGKRALEAAGRTVRVFQHPQHVLAALSNESPPDALVTDYDMNISSLNGVKLAMKIRELGHKFPVVLTSSDSLETIQNDFGEDFPDGRLHIGVAGAAIDRYVKKNKESYAAVANAVGQLISDRQRTPQ